MTDLTIAPRLWLDVYADTHPDVYTRLACHLHPSQWANEMVLHDTADWEALAIAALIAMECGHGKGLRLVSTGTDRRIFLACDFVHNIARIAGHRMRVAPADGGVWLLFRGERQAVAA